MNISFAIPQRSPGPLQSIPFRRETPVQCVIQRDAADPNGPVHIGVVNSSADNGTATVVSGGQLQVSGEVRLSGDGQTGVGHSGQLRLRAVFNGQEWDSEPFSVCSHPIEVQNGPECLPHVFFEDGTLWVGMFIRILLVSDSGVNDDLNEVDDLEKVSEPRAHSPNLNGDPGGHPETAKEERAHTAWIDRHRTQIPEIHRINTTHLNGATGEWANDQLDVFVCRRCGMHALGAALAVPNSGYRVTRIISTEPVLNRLRFLVRKEPHPATGGGSDWRTRFGGVGEPFPERPDVVG